MELKIFNNSEFGIIRTVTDKVNNVWFVGRDIAQALGYSNITDAIQNHVDDEDKHLIQKSENATFEIPNRGMMVINESGLYSLVLSSKLETAKKFKRWVTSEVLPSIRKNGGYIAGQEALSDDELLSKALLVAQNKIAERDMLIQKQTELIKEQKPKVLFAEAVSASEGSILVGDLAKLIAQNGYEIGQKRLFNWLRDNGYLIKSGSSKNMPTQRFVEQGLFEIKESVVNNPDDSIRIIRTTKVTGKGQVYFIQKFLKMKEKENYEE